MHKFWLVTDCGGRPLEDYGVTTKFDSWADAEARAELEAKEHGGNAFYVLEATHHVCMSETKVTQLEQRG